MSWNSHVHMRIRVVIRQEQSNRTIKDAMCPGYLIFATNKGRKAERDKCEN